MVTSQIGFDDLEFERVSVPFKSTRGVAQHRLVRVGMPRIPQRVINSTFYLYDSVGDAQLGRTPRGTGFVVAYDDRPSLLPPRYYGVTNWHVACDGGHSVIRLNTNDGKTDIIDFGPDQWSFIPGKYDIAAIELSLDDNVHDVSAISMHSFAAEDHIPSVFGVGDDVFMVELFF
jgi:hypothetical protein